MKTNIKEILNQLAKENDGLLMPETVVDYARPKSSPLHSRFEWRNGVAAERYRLWQARQLISVAVNYYEPSPGKKIAVRAFVSLTSDREEGGYRMTEVVMRDKAMSRCALNDALAELELFEAKYSGLKELAGVFAAIRKAKQ